MRKDQSSSSLFYGSMISCLIVVFAGVLWFSPPAQAFTAFENDAVRIQLDSTISYGLMWRVQSRDDDIIGKGEGGNKHSGNYDDGNLNYDTGLISNAIKMTSDLDIDAGWIGAFVRATGFYDYENEKGSRERTDLSSDARDAVGSDIDLLDCYLWINHEIAGMPFQVRVGEQVVSWGESTFIQNSINVINSVDVSKFRVPGAELKEGLTPEGMVWATINPTENFTVEAFYEYDWEEIKLDEPGTYFSGADFIADGGEKLMLGFSKVPDMGDAPAIGVQGGAFRQTLAAVNYYTALAGGPSDTFNLGDGTFLGTNRGKSSEADSQGQYGVALRYYSEALHSTEFSFYAMNYHARIPILQAKTANPETLGRAQAAYMTTLGMAAGAEAKGDPVTAATLRAYAPYIAIEACLENGAEYRTHYEEDLKLYGIGFNTEIAGIGVQGEISYRPDSPLQIDDLELLEAWLSPLTFVNSKIPEGNYTQSQMGNFGPDTWVNGFIEKDIIQMQTTLSYLLPPIKWLGSKGGVILGEVGLEHICGMPSKSKLRLEGPATASPGGDHATYIFGEPVEGRDHFADGDSWGYRLLARLDYFNVIGPIGFSPRIAWSHDVSGISPVGGPFLEDRKAISLGLTANYLASWTADLSYTSYFGAGSYNRTNDRDFIGFNVKYSF